MNYQIEKTYTFLEQLRDIIFYIAKTDSVVVANKVLDKLENNILSLSKFPYLGIEPKYSQLRYRGYRVLIVGNNLIFYKVEEKTKKIILYSIVYAKQNYINLL